MSGFGSYAVRPWRLALLGAGVLLGCGGGEGSAPAPGALKAARAAEEVMAPDFVVSSVTAPASVISGAPFNITVEVCNQGSDSGGTEVALVVSPDEDLSAADTMVGDLFTPWLNPGQCFTQDVPVYGSAPEGSWYLGAIADPMNSGSELDEQNNVKSGGTLGVGFLPDFVVTSVTGPTSAQPSATLPVSVTVCNQGTAERSTLFNVFLSPDADISEQDVAIAGESTGFLAPGECVTREVTVGANGADEGTYYLGAIVDAGNAREEFFESNNARASGPVTLSWF